MSAKDSILTRVFTQSMLKDLMYEQSSISLLDKIVKRYEISFDGEALDGCIGNENDIVSVKLRQYIIWPQALICKAHGLPLAKAGAKGILPVAVQSKQRLHRALAADIGIKYLIDDKTDVFKIIPAIGKGLIYCR